MSSIGSINISTASSYTAQRPARPDPSKMVDQLFSQLDTKGQGYLEKSDLQSAFDQLSTSSSTASVDEVFKQLDGNGDGKVTKDEMSSSMQKLASELDSQFDQMRMQGGMPPPPPPGGADDAGFTKDQLQSKLSDIGSSDSKRSELISKVVSNFDKADTDGDGKVSFKEAMAYDQQNSTTSTGTSTNSTSSSATTSDANGNDLAIMKRIMELMQAYASSDSSSNSLLGTLSVSA